MACKTRTHGMSKTKLYRIWADMKARCTRTRYDHYDRYGGRGIRVCDEWFNSFESFMEWANANGYAEGLSIERIDVDGDYEPLNCKWIEKWRFKTDGTPFHKIGDMECSVCHGDMLGRYYSKYCPHCGALLRGENDERTDKA